MADGYQTLLDFRDLSATYRAAPTLQGTPFTDNFFKNPTPTTADEVTVYTVGRVNQPAQGNTRGSNPRQMKNPAANKKQYALFHSFNELQLDENTLRYLMATDPGIQEIGKEIISAQIEEAGRQQRLFREVALSHIFTMGHVELDAAGNILMPTVSATTGAITNASGAAVVADWGISNNHRGNCNSLMGAAGGGLWDTASTDIFQQLANVRDQALKEGGEVPTTVWMHRKRVPSLVQNTAYKTYAQYNNIRNEDVLRGGGVDNLYGWNFRFLDGYWTDSAGTQRPIIPTTRAILTPDLGDWVRCKEGTQMVPTMVGVTDSIEAAMSSRKPVVGMFSFAQVKVSPLVVLSLYLGDNFGIGFPNASSIWFPDVFAT